MLVFNNSYMISHCHKIKSILKHKKTELEPLIVPTKKMRNCFHKTFLPTFSVADYAFHFLFYSKEKIIWCEMIIFTFHPNLSKWLFLSYVGENSEDEYSLMSQ